jgi:uncharacterized protein
MHMIATPAGKAKTLSAAEARRIALGAQGLGTPRTPGPVGQAQLRAIVSRLRVLQLDPINVLVRAHYLPAFSRLGPYRKADLDALAYDKRELFEYVGHEWSLLPVDVHPLMRWRMHAFANDPRWPNDLPAGYPEAVLAELAEQGPLTPAELSAPGRRGGRFKAKPGKRALTWLTQSGQVAVAYRRGNQPVYDLAERVIPADVLAAPTPERDQARKELLMLAAHALGVATAKDLASYFLIGLGVPGFSERTVYPRSATVAQLVDELAAEGRLQRVAVEGWRQPAFLHPHTSVPAERGCARALLSPFDSLLWERDRVERLFGFRYRSEIYTPAAKRQYGYYVLPFLLDDTLVARVDLKADRDAGTLAVLGAYAEPGVHEPRVAAELGTELRALAGWLALDQVQVADRGDLSHELSGRFPQISNR